jgi:hypothetical protein
LNDVARRATSLVRRWPMLTRLVLPLIVAALLLLLCALVYRHIEPTTPP